MSRGCRLNRGDHAKVTTSLTPGEDRGSHSHPASGVCRKNEFLCANSVTLCVSVVKLPGKTFTTEARSLHREPRRTFSDRLLRGLNHLLSTVIHGLTPVAILLPPTTQASSTLTKC